MHTTTQYNLHNNHYHYHKHGYVNIDFYIHTSTVYTTNCISEFLRGFSSKEIILYLEQK